MPAQSRAQNQPEVLAPAGSHEALRQALAQGADSVYFGLQEGFNARARAENFSLANLQETVREVHRAGARAYVTLNTLVFEPELEHVERIVRAVAEAGVDALIVQDPVVCLIAHEVCPRLELHASTQMTIASPKAAKLAELLHVTRVVVPRELSVEEIAKFRAGTGLELEVFIHGALCVSWSGQCLTSEAWGGRSANRGQCSQECRMPYELVVDGEKRALPELRYLLSPRDLAGAPAVPELIELGVHGLKIEGRQKSPQYVATSVAGYRRWVDAVCGGGDREAAKRQLARDLLAMELSYSRGFSTGFLAGPDHQTLVEGRFPKHRGAYVGRVVRVLERGVLVREELRGGPELGIAPLEIRPGMGVVFDQGDPESKAEPGGPVWSVARRGAEIELGFGPRGPDLARLRARDRVWVTSDPTVAGTLDARPTGRIGIALSVRGEAGGPLAVAARGKGLVAAASSTSLLEPAHGAGLSEAIVRDKLGAFGGTPFFLAELDLQGLAAGLHLPVAELKQLRRSIVGELERLVDRGPEREVSAEPALARAVARAAVSPQPRAVGQELVPLVRNGAQLDAVLASGLPEVELDWMELAGLAKAVARARSAGLRVCVATLRVGKPGEEPIDERLLRLEPDALLVRHWGALERALEARAGGASLDLHGDFSLNVTNSVTARFLLSRGLATVTASHDLDEAQMLALLGNTPEGRVAVTVQHRIPTFHTEHCLYSHLLSQGKDYRTCGRPCERHEIAVEDHEERRHEVIVDAGCRNTVFHATAQSKAPWAARLVASGVRRLRVEFVRESGDEVARALSAWRELIAGRVTPDDVLVRTGAEPHFGVTRGAARLLT